MTEEIHAAAIADIVKSEIDFAVFRLRKTGNHTQERRFAGTVRSADGRKLSGGKFELETGEQKRVPAHGRYPRQLESKFCRASKSWHSKWNSHILDELLINRRGDNNPPYAYPLSATSGKLRTRRKEF